MPSNIEDRPARITYLLPAKRSRRILVVGALFLVALGVRLDRISNPPIDFAPTRQYRSALIARAYYFRTLDSAPEWERRVAAINLAKTPLLECPIIEHLAFLAYRVAGGEHLWIPRALLSVFWVIGGLFLYTIAKRIASPDSALLATAFYLFVPFGITASRAFQRDSLMIMLMLASLFAIVRYADRPSLRALIAAALLSAVPIFIKPICFFPIAGAYIALAIRRTSVVKAMLSPHSILFAVLSLLPTIAYTFYGLFVSGFLAAQAERSFVPYMFLSPFFWHGWLRMIAQTVGLPAFGLALFGLCAFRDSFARALAVGLWAGYFVFGLVFSYGIHTHDYYQLMLIPIVALSLVPIAEMLLAGLRQASPPPLVRIAAWAVLILGGCLAVEPLVWLRTAPSFKREVALREEIGNAADHNTKTLILDRGYGKILKYHGKLCGHWWPCLNDLRQSELLGQPQLSTQERLDTLIEEHSPDLFIVVALSEYGRQKELEELLTRRYRKLHDTDNYIIFDLTERIDLKEPERHE